MTRSLRGRLFIGLAAVILLAGAAGGALTYIWAYEEAIEMQDSVLIQVGTLAMASPIKQSRPASGVDAESEVNVVELADASPTTASNDRFWKLKDGLRDDTYGGQQVRALLATRSDGGRFAVTQRADIRTELASNMALRTLLPIAAMIPCLMLVVAVVIERSLRPLTSLADELDKRKAENTAQLAVNDVPSELQPFLASINGLLDRIRLMMEQQRRFISDAAHELRTPITALSLQAENLDASDVPPAMRDRLHDFRSGIARAKLLLEQLLALARQESASHERYEIVQLDAISKGVVADLLPQAEARNLDLGFAVTEPVAVNGDTLALQSAVRNLVENAIKFTPDGGKVDLSVYREGEIAVLVVEDTGPGIPASDLSRIFEPFFRGKQPSGDGSGLGLSIVKRIVDRMGGRVDIENVVGPERTGLRATLRLKVNTL